MPLFQIITGAKLLRCVWSEDLGGEGRVGDERVYFYFLNYGLYIMFF